MRALPPLLLAGLILPLTIHAQTTPYVRLTGGLLLINPGQNQTIHFNPSYWKTDVADKNWDSQAYGGIGAGLRIPASETLVTELGAGLYAAAPFTASGAVYQYSSPQFNNLECQYQIQHTRLMLEGKLLNSYHTIYHPYLSAGVGVSRQHSYDYQETPTQAYAVADPAFAAHTTYSIAYSAGVGIDVDINRNWRVGGGYEFTHLGTAVLGAAPGQQDGGRISTGALSASQLMLQFTYAG